MPLRPGPESGTPAVEDPLHHPPASDALPLERESEREREREREKEGERGRERERGEGGVIDFRAQDNLRPIDSFHGNKAPPLSCRLHP